MNTEEQKTLERTLELSEENNKLLKKINRSIQWGRFVKLVYWLIIIGLSVGAFYYIQPLLEPFMQTVDSLSSGVKSLEQVSGSLPDLSSLDVSMILEKFNTAR